MSELTKKEFWRDRPVLVTGASGLLGGCMVRRLSALGADVVCLVRDWIPGSILLGTDLRAQVKVVGGDVTDQGLLERILAEYEIDIVEHLAAQTIVGVALRSPTGTFETNIAGTWRILEACRRVGVRGIVIASSDKAYGQQEALPYTEETPLGGRYPYDASKSCADILASTYARTYGLNAAVTRCGNFYGGGDLNWNRLIPGTIRSAIRGQRPVIRSDGTFTRDYLYIEDAVEAYLDVSMALVQRSDIGGQAFNFSTERPLSALTVVETILGTMGSNLEPDIRNEARGEIPHQWLSAAKARSVLGWKPLFTFEDAIKRTIGWYADYFKAKAS